MNEVCFWGRILCFFVSLMFLSGCSPSIVAPDEVEELGGVEVQREKTVASEPANKEEVEPVVDAGQKDKEPVPETKPEPSGPRTLKIVLSITPGILAICGSTRVVVKATITEPALSEKELSELKLVVHSDMGQFVDGDGKPLSPVSKSPDLYRMVFRQGAFYIELAHTGQEGDATLTALVAPPNPMFRGEAKTTLPMRRPHRINVSFGTPSIFVAGASPSSTSITAEVVNEKGQPVGAGVPVHVSIFDALPGTSVQPAKALTDVQGVVTVRALAGYQSGSTRIHARTVCPSSKDTSCPVRCNSDSDCNNFCGSSCVFGTCSHVVEDFSKELTVLGGAPSYRDMKFTCSPTNLEALVGRIGNSIATTVTSQCSVTLFDRHKNPIGLPSQVHFRTEAGAMDPVATGRGLLSALIRTQNPPPVDVAPLQVPNVNNCDDPQCSLPKASGYGMPYNCTQSALANEKMLDVEPWYKDQFGRVRNPRDGLVTIIAYTRGEEQFTDTNKNRRYDVGEPFVDLGEPYLDVNDNNKWDANLPGLPNGEPYIDIPCTEQEAKNGTNGCKQEGIGNGRRDGPNGLWDANTLIWKKTWVLWTGCTKEMKDTSISPAVDLQSCTKIPFQSGVYSSQDLTGLNHHAALAYNLPKFTPLKNFAIAPKKPLLVKTLWHDENLNPLAQRALATHSSFDVKITSTPSSPALGYHFYKPLGFVPLQRLVAQSKLILQDLYVIPSFYGVSSPLLYSHLLEVSDRTGQTEPEQSAQIELRVLIPATTCDHTLTVKGTTQ